MVSDDLWSQLDPMSGFAPMTPGVSTDVAAGGLSSAGIIPVASKASPDHPLFWVAAICGLTVGLIGASTHLHAGPFKVSASAGKDS